MGDEQDLSTVVVRHEEQLRQLKDGAQAWWESVQTLALTRQSLDQLTAAVRDLIENERTRVKTCAEHQTELTMLKAQTERLEAIAENHEVQIAAIKSGLDKLAWKVGLILAGAAFLLNKLWAYVPHIFKGGTP